MSEAYISLVHLNTFLFPSPRVNLGNVFQYILSTRDFDSDYIGKFNDQKAYNYFDSGFVGQIFIHEPGTRGNIKPVSLMLGVQCQCTRQMIYGLPLKIIQ